MDFDVSVEDVMSSTSFRLESGQHLEDAIVNMGRNSDGKSLGMYFKGQDQMLGCFGGHVRIYLYSWAH